MINSWVRIISEPRNTSFTVNSSLLLTMSWGNCYIAFAQWCVLTSIQLFRCAFCRWSGTEKNEAVLSVLYVKMDQINEFILKQNKTYCNKMSSRILHIWGKFCPFTFDFLCRYGGRDENLWLWKAQFYSY